MFSFKYVFIEVLVSMPVFIYLLVQRYMSRVKGKQTFCICENKGAYQLRSYCALYYTNSTIIQNFQRLAIICVCTARFVQDLCRNHILGIHTRLIWTHVTCSISFYTLQYLSRSIAFGSTGLMTSIKRVPTIYGLDQR